MQKAQFLINLVFFGGAILVEKSPQLQRQRNPPLGRNPENPRNAGMQSIQVFGPFLGTIDFSWFISRWHDFHPLSQFGSRANLGNPFECSWPYSAAQQAAQTQPLLKSQHFFWSISKTRLLDRIQTQQQFMVHFHVPKRGRKTWQSCEPWTPNKRIWYSCDTQITLV